MKRALSESDSDDGGYNDEEKDLCEEDDTGEASARRKRRGLIEKKRRDRINTCLAELRKLVPAAVERQGSAKLEKAEILQLTVEHLKAMKKTAAKGQNGGSIVPTMDLCHAAGFQHCMAETARFLYSMDIEPPKPSQGTDQANNGMQRAVRHQPTQKSVGLASPVTPHGPIQDIWSPQSYSFLPPENFKSDPSHKGTDAALKLEPAIPKIGLSAASEASHLSPQGPLQFLFPLKHPVLPLHAPDMMGFQLSLLSPYKAESSWPYSMVTKSNTRAPPAMFGPWAPQILGGQT